MNFKISLLVFSLFLMKLSYSQTYNMGSTATGTITTNSGTFYDSGGPSGPYGNSQNHVVTFCSPSGHFSLTFLQFSTELDYDFLQIFDGPSTSSPLILTSSGNVLPNSGNPIVSTGSCLTIRFFSDYAVGGTGWAANIGSVANTNLDTDGDGIIDSIDIDDDNDGVLDVTEGMCYDSQANYPLAGSTAYPIFYSYNSGLFDDWSSPAANNLIINPNNNPISGTNCTIAKNGINGNAIITNVNSANLATAKASNEYIGFSFTTKNNVFNASIEHLFYYREVASNYTMTWAISSDNINFVDLATSTYSGAVGSYPTNTVQMDISNYPLAPNATYFIRIYIYGLSSGTTAYIDNMGISFDWCDDIFTDADAIPNRLDLDSDGDGCSDAIEAGSSTTATSTTVYPTGTDTNGNGLLNGYEGSPSGTIFYTSNYYTYAVLAGVSACTDTDGDGIKDRLDIDDDNDGVLDVTEATACNNSTPGVSPNASWGQSVGLFFGFDSNLSDNYSGANNLVANPNSYAITASNCNIAASGSATITNVNSTSLTQAKSTNEYIGFSFTTKNNVFDASIEHFSYYRAFASTYTMTWAISSDNINFRDLSTNTYTGAVGGFPNNTVAINIPNYMLAPNTTYYIRIYIYNISGGVTTAYIDDIGVAFDWCEELDTDGDNIPNHLDLDSDNDGCSDAIEAGASTTATDTAVYPSGPDTNGNGFLNEYESSTTAGTINYTSTYVSEALLSGLNKCKDTDDDGVPDWIDIDDDNDGVLDTEEGCGPVQVLNHDFKAGWTGWMRTFSAPLNPDLNFLPSTATQATNGFYATWDPSWDFNLTKSIDVNASDLLDITITIGKSQVQANDRIEVYVGGTLVKTYYTQDIPGSIASPSTFNFQFASPVANPLVRVRFFHDNASGTNDFNLTALTVNRVCNKDTDNDLIPDYLDLDSDQDGCSDAIEAGSSATATSTSVYPTGTDANGNGLLDEYENGNTGVVNYNSTYAANALQNLINGCTDTDGDGVRDANDLDDDNDGVLDHVESPSCYMTPAEWNTTNKTWLVSISTQLNTKNNVSFSVLTDNEASSSLIGFTSLANSPQPQLDKEIFKFTFAKPLRLHHIYIKKENATAIFGNVASSLRLQGSNDNANWTNLTPNAVGQPVNGSFTTQGVVSLTNTDRFSVEQNGAAYKYYRIYGVAAANILGGNFSEVYFDVHSSYSASYFPKPGCTFVDTDNDNVSNHLDLDSDDDGCSDSFEAGATTTATSTTDYPTGADDNSNGLFNIYENTTTAGTINYTSTYVPWAIDNGLVRPHTLTMAVGSGSINQNVCLGFLFPSIILNTTGATGASITAGELPPGLTATWANNVVTISGTPTQAGTYDYTIETSGGCQEVLSNGTIVVTPAPVSGPFTGNQAICVGETTTFSFATAGGEWTSSNTAVATIDPDTGAINGVSAGTATMTYVLSGGTTGCPETVATRAVTINPINTVSLAPNRIVCVNAAFANITLATTGATGATVTGLPTGLSGTWASGVVTISGTPSAVGTFDYTVTTTGGCTPAITTGKITVKSCVDTDQDGVIDDDDIDDDNDGVLDAVESSNCYYTAGEWLSGARSGITVSTGLEMISSLNQLQGLVDGVAGSSQAVSFVTTFDAGRVIYQFDMPIPVELSTIYLNFANGNTHFMPGTVLNLQGSNDNVNWTYLAGGYGSTNNIPGYGSVTQAYTFSPTHNQGKYSHYRIRWMSGGYIIDVGHANEVFFEVTSNYNPSAHPKPNCTPTDTDGDALPNHLDLDSDNDGCSDAIEAGASTTATSTTVYNNGGAGTDTNGNGLLNIYENTTTAGTINYTSTYTTYGLEDELNFCKCLEAPTLSGTILSSNCSSGVSVNLNSLITSTAPDNSILVWFTNDTHTGLALVNPTIVDVSGTYYAYYYNALLDCYTPASLAVTVVINKKTWNGSVDTNWSEGLNWTPSGVPSSSDYVEIPLSLNHPVISGSSYLAYACALKVQDGASLIVNSSNSITVVNEVIVLPTGTFRVENNASLVQINNVSNTGNIIYKRIASVRNLDYVYWSSPVLGMNINNIVNPLVLGPIYKWNPTVVNANGGEGNWESAYSNIMLAAKGYIARAPSSFNSTTAQPLEATFIGVATNGIITYTIERGTDTNTNYHVGNNGIEISNYSDNWNLLGNPYPSSIRASQFLVDNASKIEGTVRLWTHGNLPSTSFANPFYNSYTYNYTASDYLTYNFTGTSCCPLAPDDLFIGGSQGFFVQMKDGPSGTDTVSFNNALRNGSYSNSLFYRASSTSVVNSSFNINFERNRIWLDIVNSNGQSDRTLFGYIEGATMDYDSFYDSYTAVSGPMTIYSVHSDKKFIIQGRALPFNDTDEVPIGVHLPTAGNYTISIGAVDGLFDTQNIYLKDGLLNIIHDLKVSPYIFSSAASTINDRFSIVYKNGTLDLTDHTIDYGVLIGADDKVFVHSFGQNIREVVVFDVLGRMLKSYKNVAATELIMDHLQKTNTVLLVKVFLENGMEVNKKVLF